MIALAVITFITLSAASLAYLTLSQAKERSAYYFGIVVALVTIWVPLSYIGNSNMFEPAVLSWFTYADYVIGIWVLAAVAVFAFEITSSSKHLRAVRLIVPYTCAFFVTVLLAQKQVITIDTALVDGFVRSEKQGYYGVYAAYGIVMLLLSIAVLSRRLWRAESDDDRRRYKPIVSGFVSAGVLTLVGTFLVPALTDDRTIRTIGSQVSYIGVVVTMYFIWNAIFRFGLFSISQTAARAAAYIFAIIVLLPVYVALGLVGQALLGPGESLKMTQLLTNVVFIIPLLLLYPVTKRWFERTTNEFFFRDAYDPNTFFAELNNVLVTYIDVERLLEESRHVIEKNMKAEYVDFLLLTTSYYENRTIGAHNQKIKDSEVEQLRATLPNIRKKVIYTRAHGKSLMENDISRMLENNEVQVLARIVGNVHVSTDGLGYMLLGKKRTGKPYTVQDIAVLENIADTIQLAVENALRFEEIQQFNVTLQNKIDDATTELKTSNEKLKALDEAKDEFISMASHQLRTPLTSIKGYASMLADGDSGNINDGQKKMLGQILFSSQRMVSLIADMLNVSRLKTGKFVIKKTSVYLPDVVETELEQVAEGAAVKNIKLVFDKPKQFPSIELDETKIRQVIMNFVDNAIYYTPRSGTIAVTLTATTDQIECTVVDTGIGVPAQQQDKLFTKFYRADNARKTRPDGTGLGLFMAEKVISAHEGTVIFSSVEGKGSIFGFKFPR